MRSAGQEHGIIEAFIEGATFGHDFKWNGADGAAFKQALVRLLDVGVAEEEAAGVVLVRIPRVPDRRAEVALEEHEALMLGQFDDAASIEEIASLHVDRDRAIENSDQEVRPLQLVGADGHAERRLVDDHVTELGAPEPLFEGFLGLLAAYDAGGGKAHHEGIYLHTCKRPVVGFRRIMPMVVSLQTWPESPARSRLPLMDSVVLGVVVPMPSLAVSKRP